MKKSKIKEEIRVEADNFTPNPLDKIKQQATTENIMPSKAETATSIKKMGKWRIATSFAVVALCCVLAFYFIFGFSGASMLLSPKQAYAIGSVSSVKLLNSNVQASAIKTLAEVNDSTSSSSNEVGDIVKDQAEKFNEYFSALDSFFGEDVVSVTTSENQDEGYDYETKMIIRGKNFTGGTVEYVMYYTETQTSHSKTLGFEREEETSYSLKGVMVIDERNYYLEGERVEEKEDDESETELKIRAYKDELDKTSFVEMKQENSVEDDETEVEFVYSIYSNGNLIEQTAVEFETEREGGEIETEYSLEFRNSVASGRFVVEKVEKDGSVVINVKYSIGQEKGKFSIFETTDENGEKHYEYVFEDGTKKLF